LIPEKILNIVNGQVMYDKFKETRFLEPEKMIPFNEAMCYGETSSDLFSQKFIKIRSNVHHVTIEQYKEITLRPLQPFISGDFTKVALWFDRDMFCQINLLTILAWLDLTGHKNDVILHIVDEKLEPLELNPKGYYQHYHDILIHKKIPAKTLPAHLQKSIELYVSYLKKDSSLIQYIRKYNQLPENELVTLLIKNFTDYGLGDVQYLEIIKAELGEM
jgi:hypothetical protein